MPMIRTILPREEDNEKRLLRISSPQEIAASYQAYLTDESRFSEGRAEEILFPLTEAQVCRILKEMSKKHTPVTISGARTGITSASMPRGGVLINMERMNRVLDIIHESDGRWSVWLEPGVRLADFHEQVEGKNLPLPEKKMAPFLSDPHTYFYPPDPTEESALVGSTVATNASGARSFRYGATRNFVHGLRVALSTGEVLALERGRCKASSDGLFHIMHPDGIEISFAPPGYTTPALKSTCGYFSKPGMDLLDLFIGSEGTLGVITAVRLRLEKKPDAILSALSFFPGEDEAISCVVGARRMLSPLCLEYFDSHSLDLVRREGGRFSVPDKARAAVFWEKDYQEGGLEQVYKRWEGVLTGHGSSMDDTWSGLEKGDWMKLKEFRHSVPELVNRIIGHRKARDKGIYKVSTDMAVPDQHLGSMIAEYTEILDSDGLEYVIFGHIGDNHLHVNILPRSMDDVAKAQGIVMSLARKVVSLGGIVAAEHGIGKLKHELVKIQYGEEGLEEMARVKRALDPSQILGRGNIFPEALLKGECLGSTP